MIFSLLISFSVIEKSVKCFFLSTTPLLLCWTTPHYICITNISCFTLEKFVLLRMSRNAYKCWYVWENLNERLWIIFFWIQIYRCDFIFQLNFLLILFSFNDFFRWFSIYLGFVFLLDIFLRKIFYAYIFWIKFLLIQFLFDDFFVLTFFFKLFRSKFLFDEFFSLTFFFCHANFFGK